MYNGNLALVRNDAPFQLHGHSNGHSSFSLPGTTVPVFLEPEPARHTLFLSIKGRDEAGTCTTCIVFSEKHPLLNPLAIVANCAQ